EALVIPEIIGCCLFAVLICRLSVKGQSGTITPFFIFFYSTGIAGIVSIIGGWFIRLSISLPITHDTAYLAYIGHWWNKRNMTRLIIIQFGVPSILHLYYIKAEIDWEFRDGVWAYDGLAETAGLLNHLLFGVAYVAYVFASTALNGLTVLQLRKLIKQGTLSQSKLLHQNKVLVLYGICSTMAHFICAIHQIYWAWAYFSENEFHQDLARDMSTPVNDITTFCNPVLLLIVSPHARSALYSRSMNRSKVKSTSQSQTFIPIALPQRMHDEWPLLLFPELTSTVLDLFSREGGEEVASRILCELLKDIQGNSKHSQLDDDQIRWLMQVLNHALSLPLSTERQFKCTHGAVQSYLHWLKALTSVIDPSIPRPLIETPEQYFRSILDALRSIFVRRKWVDSISVGRQAGLIESTLDTIKLITKEAREKYQDEVWSRSLSFSLNCTHLLLAPPAVPGDISCRVGGSVIDSLLSLWMHAV
ncbi:hypothetical protein PENTCL1PPCAC_6517, partial [Pristionchus entomophagus]